VPDDESANRGAADCLGAVDATPKWRELAAFPRSDRCGALGDCGCRLRGVGVAHGHLFGWPFHGIVVGTMTYPALWTNLVLSFFWIALVLLGVGMMFSSNLRKYANNYPNEAIFCRLYLFAIFSYDYLIWARSNFIRFCIPTLLFVFFCTIASFAEGPQGDLGPLHREYDGIRRFGCRGKKRISGDGLKRPRRAGLPSGGNAYLFKVAGQSIGVTHGIRADPGGTPNESVLVHRSHAISVHRPGSCGLAKTILSQSCRF
jgi:hypothetical protein